MDARQRAYPYMDGLGDHMQDRAAAERHDPKLVAIGTVVVALSVPGFAWSVPHGPLWLIVACAAMEGGGFRLAWTFILRRAIALAPAGETERIAAAIPIAT